VWREAFDVGNKHGPVNCLQEVLILIHQSVLILSIMLLLVARLSPFSLSNPLHEAASPLA
jgi:hypothetical protein